MEAFLQTLLLLLLIGVTGGRAQQAPNVTTCVPGPTQRLSNGVDMPRVSFGTAALPRGRGHERIIAAALDAGFRSFDTAQATEWYDEVAVASTLNASRLPRSHFFVTTKLHPRDLGYDAAKIAIEKSLARFDFQSEQKKSEQAPYLDLVLLHYPRCFSPVCTTAEQRRTETPDKTGEVGWRAAWRALTEFVAVGKIRAIGVSNFDLTELQHVKPQPHVVQNWFDPFRQDRNVLEWCRANSVAYTSYSTLGGQWTHQRTPEDGGHRANPVFTSRVLRDIAAAHSVDVFRGRQDDQDQSPQPAVVSPAHVVLSWALQRGVLVLPRSSSSKHIDENAVRFLPERRRKVKQQRDGSQYSGELSTTPYTLDTEANKGGIGVFLSEAELHAIDVLDGTEDSHSQCPHWAGLGECEKNPRYMLNSCRVSCDVEAAPSSIKIAQQPALLGCGSSTANNFGNREGGSSGEEL